MRYQIGTSDSGSVSVEMLLALFPLLFAFLGVAQLSLHKMGELVVTHAATRAVRAAVVVINDDPDHYEGSPARGDLTAGGSQRRSGLASFVNDVEDKYAQLLSGKERTGGARLQQIRDAAYHPLAVLAPPLRFYAGKKLTLEEEIGSSPWLRLVAGLHGYAPSAASVTVHQNESEDPKNFVSHGGTITVKISFLMPCGVPLVSSLLCVNGHDIVKANLGLPTSSVAEKMSAAATLVESPVGRDLLLAGDGRFIVITKQASLPNQSVRYHGDES